MKIRPVAVVMIAIAIAAACVFGFRLLLPHATKDSPAPVSNKPAPLANQPPLLESLAYQTRDVLTAMQADAGLTLRALRVDGGAIANDFTAQFQADILDIAVERPSVKESTALGAAYLAGLAVGFWESREQIAQQRQVERTFVPEMAVERRERLYKGWKQAVQATLAFNVERTD